MEIYNPLTGLSCDIEANLTLKNHAQIGLTICGGFEGNTSFPQNCSRLDMEDGEFDTLNLGLSQLYDPALSWSSAEGFVVCGEENCDLVKSDDTVEENYITLYPQPESVTVTRL